MNWTGEARRAMEIALRKLASRDLVEKEIRSALDHEQVDGATQNQVVQALVDWSLLDDSRTAENRIESLQRRGYGKLKILVELERRGVSPELLAVIEANIDCETEFQCATRALGKKVRTPPQVARFLASRGFEPEIIERVLEQLESYSP